MKGLWILLITLTIGLAASALEPRQPPEWNPSPDYSQWESVIGETNEEGLIVAWSNGMVSITNPDIANRLTITKGALLKEQEGKILYQFDESMIIPPVETGSIQLKKDSPKRLIIVDKDGKTIASSMAKRDDKFWNGP